MTPSRDRDAKMRLSVLYSSHCLAGVEFGTCQQRRSIRIACGR